MSLPTTDEEVLLLHNPRCSKSRATAALLAEKGIAFTERRYLDDPLSVDELSDLEARLARPLREWVRSGEATFRDKGLDLGSEPNALRQAVAADPILMERPIVVRGKHARVGRPPAQVLELFEAD